MANIRFEVGKGVEERLDRAVAAEAERQGIDLSNRKAKELVELGRVHIDGRKAWKASRSLSPGQFVVANIPDEWCTPSEPTRADLADRILYADEHIVAVDKPVGLPTHATHDPDRDHVRAALERWLASTGIEHPYVGIHHRLDVDTTGVLLFAIDRTANKGLADAFSERTIDKEYAAIVVGEPSLEFEVENHLDYDRSEGRMTSTRSGGDYARTGFRREQAGRGVSLVRAALHTGRRHQIRVHLAGTGHPILGDTLYGGPTTMGGFTTPRTLLHAARLSLDHPVTSASLTIEAPLPEDMEAAIQHFALRTDD